MTEFSFEGMSITRVIAHTVFARSQNGPVPPATTNQLILLNPESKDLIQQRITEALASKSHGIEMEISKEDAGSFMQLGASMMYCSDDQFIEQSRTLAENLTEAQTSSRWPGGILILISGKVGVPQKRFLAAMKAETDKGFNVEEGNGAIDLKLIKKMLLSQTQKLHKVGMLVEINHQPAGADGLFSAENYRSFLFDHLLRATETKSAAAYFYEAFLGMNIQSSAKFQTKLFYDQSKSFIDTLDATDEVKHQLRESLRAELRSQKGTLHVADFAEEHLPEEYADSYVNVLLEAGFPDHAVVKDIDYIKSKLKRPRRMIFTTGVRIDVPSKVDLREHVQIVSQEEGHSTVRIKGIIQDQE